MDHAQVHNINRVYGRVLSLTSWRQLQGREAAQCDDRPRKQEAETDRLGAGRVLPPRPGVQRAGGQQVRQQHHG